MTATTPSDHSFANISSADRRERTDDLVHRLSISSAAEREALLEELILVNLCVARSIAQRYRGRGIELDDLEQVAGAALVRATQHFDPTNGADFMAYVVPSIRGEVRRHFRDRAWMVRPPRRVQDLRLRALDERDRQRGLDDAGPVTAGSVAEALDVEADDVTEALASEGCFSPTSLDRPLGDGLADLGDLLTDPRGAGDLREAEARMMLEPLLAGLSPRDQRLVGLRFYEQLTQREIAEEFGVTQTHVSRLLHGILDSLREQLTGDRPDEAVLPGE